MLRWADFLNLIGGLNRCQKVTPLGGYWRSGCRGGDILNAQDIAGAVDCVQKIKEPIEEEPIYSSSQGGRQREHH